MAVKTWILGALSVADHILDSGPSCWNRPDLVNVPDMLRYSQKQSNGSYVYENNIGIVIVLTPYAEFETFEDMDKDYYSESGDSIYNSAYQKMIDTINECYPNQKALDVDWVIPLSEGELEFNENYCKLKDIGEESKAYVSVIDCSMIYTSIQHIADFVHYICRQKSLTKYQRWQLAYYQMAVQAIENPNVYLTNKDETLMYKELYSCWKIGERMKALIEHLNQAVTLFSFLSNYEENEENDLFSSFLTFFGIVVGLEAIYNLWVTLFLDIRNGLSIIFVSIIAIVVVWFGVIFFKKALKKSIEKKEFYLKTNSKRKNKK